MAAPGGAADERGVRTVGAVSGFLAGLVGIVLLASDLTFPPFKPATALTDYQQHQFAWSLFVVAIALEALVGVPYYASLARVLRPRGPSLASSATLFAVVGIFTAAISNVLQVGLMATVAGASSSATPTQQAVAPFFVWIFGASGQLVTFGFVTWAAGIALFGALMWNSHLFPNWLGVLGLVAGGLVILSLTPIIGLVLLLAGGMAVVLWAFASGMIFWRSRTGPSLT